MKLMKRILALGLSCALLCGAAGAKTVYSDSYLKLSGIAVESTGVDEDGDLTYQVTAKATTPGDNIHHISVQFKDYSTDETVAKVLYGTDQEEAGVYSGTLTISRSAKAGTYHLQKATLVDTHDDYFVYYTSSDYEEDSEHQRKLPNSASFQIATGVTKVDETAPVLTAFSVTPQTIEPEEKVTVTAAAADDSSGMDSIKVRFVEKATGRGLSLSLEQQADGSWRESFSPSQTKDAGVYQLEKVMLKDLAGNRSVLLPGQGILPKEFGFTITEDGFGSGLPFTDVSGGALYAPAVQYVYEHGLMNGTTASTFSPDAAVSRGTLVTLLYRLEGSPAVTDSLAFSDVDAGATCAKAVVWATEQGLISGYEDGSFQPGKLVNRQQTAAIFYRYAELHDLMKTAPANQISTFADFAEVSDYAIPAMNWAVANQLLKSGSNQINPTGTISRAEMAQVLMQYAQLSAE